MMRGNRPICSAMARASAGLWATPLTGTSRPIESISSLKARRSSPRSMASGLAPISSMPYLARTPWRCRAMAVLSAVCPPRVGSSTSLWGTSDFGLWTSVSPTGTPRRRISSSSRAMIFSTTSGVIGSM